MVYWLEGVLLYIASFLVQSNGVDPSPDCLDLGSHYHIDNACECVVYQSYGQSQGRFHSPNHPTAYKRGINCILFSFIGDVNEIIEISFMEFDLKPPTPSYVGSREECQDWLKIYQNLDSPVVYSSSQHDKQFCGNISNLEEKTFYSSGRGLILEFHTSSGSEGTFTGFKGIYKFLLKSTFETDGDLQSGSQCTYLMQSYNNRTHGKFYSPRYPQKYPREVNCQYVFFGHKDEQVKIEFLNIQLPSEDKRCKENSGDSITVYDGEDRSHPIKEIFCDVHNREEIISTGPYMFIEFHSDRQHEKKGFAATYKFINKNATPPPPLPNSRNGSSRRKSGTDGTCGQIINSKDGKKSGEIQSPYYPRSYPSSITCQYEFHGVEQERVQIRFKQLNLHYTGVDPTDPYDCKAQDSISVYVIDDDENEEMLTMFCGRKIPLQLMSSNTRLKVVFQSMSSRHQDDSSGFQFEYTFRTDFGIQGNGIQDPRKGCFFKYLSNLTGSGNFTSPNYPGDSPSNIHCQYVFHGRSNEKVHIVFIKFDLDLRGKIAAFRSCKLKGCKSTICIFSFHSRHNLQGKFTSPNYVGLYPRDTICTYIFIGNKNERVKIVFEKFDVDGILPRCDTETNSDTVSFSNYLNTDDRKMQKFCGKKQPSQAHVSSDGPFFRAEFRSNSIFDATGFVGSYTFLSANDEPEMTTPNPARATGSGSRPIATLLVVVMATCVSLCQTVIQNML